MVVSISLPWLISDYTAYMGDFINRASNFVIGLLVGVVFMMLWKRFVITLNSESDSEN